MEILATTTLGLPNDPSLAWNEKEEQWRLLNKIYRTQDFTQSAEGHTRMVFGVQSSVQPCLSSNFEVNLC